MPKSFQPITVIAPLVGAGDTYMQDCVKIGVPLHREGFFDITVRV
jgi:hypothetical protein